MTAHAAPPAGAQARPVNAGGVPALVVGEHPDRPPHALFLHGGGFVLGSAFGYRPLAGALALAAGTGVLVTDHRLAPEHPFPAALDDACAAYRWMLDRGTAPERLVVAGDSVGGGLALALLLRLREEGTPLPGGAALLCPTVDLTQGSLDVQAAHPDSARYRDLGRRCAEAYLAGHPSDDPLASPLFGDLAGLPPLLVQAATGDAAVGDARALHARARAAGAPCELQLYAADAHGFQLYWSFLPEAAAAVDAAGRFMRGREQGGITR
jgi:acetyl esterase/lipase